MEYRYDHFGVPSQEKLPGMIYYPEYKVWASDWEKDPYRIERLFFEKGCPMHPLIQSAPHVCFFVDDIEKAVRGKKILLKPVLLEDTWMAFIEEKGVPIEFFQKVAKCAPGS